MTAGQGRHGQSWCAAFIFGPAPGARVRTPQECTAILDQQLTAVASQGGRVETRTANAAVVVTGKPVNHVLHLLLSLFLCTMWVPVWIMAAVGGERRATISVDPTGGVHLQKAPMTAGRIVPIVLAVLWGVFLLWFLASCASSFSHNS
jgi:hypothetical protein